MGMLPENKTNTSITQENSTKNYEKHVLFESNMQCDQVLSNSPTLKPLLVLKQKLSEVDEKKNNIYKILS